MDALTRGDFASQADWRPQLHFTAPRGWINDPNGLYRLGTSWRLHYQFEWPRRWGQATSEDLFHWEHLPVALEVDELGDCWSGGTVWDRTNTSGLFPEGSGGLVSIYTSQHAEHGQRISLASSADEGKTWTKFAGNPVLGRQPRGCRDPKVFWHEPAGAWLLVLTENTWFTFFRSDNLREWTETGRFTLAPTEGVDGYECPDLFPLPVANRPGEMKWVLACSYSSGENFKEGGGFGACGQRYHVGTFDGATFRAEAGGETGFRFGAGPDEYAAIVWPQEEDGDRRTIAIGWMCHWGYAGKIPTVEWQGCLTLPRELTLFEMSAGQWQLRQAPARELWTLPQKRRSIGRRTLDAATGRFALGDFRRGAVKARLKFDPDLAPAPAEVFFEVFAGARHATRIGYDQARGQLSFDRRDSGHNEFHPNFGLHQETPLKVAREGMLDVIIVIDGSTVEVFAGAGAVCLSALTFPRHKETGVNVQVLKGSIEFEEIEVIEFL